MEPEIDEINDTSIILADGTELTFSRLGRIVKELSPTSLLRTIPAIGKWYCASDASAILKQAAALFEALSRADEKALEYNVFYKEYDPSSGKLSFECKWNCDAKNEVEAINSLLEEYQTLPIKVMECRVHQVVNKETQTC